MSCTKPTTAMTDLIVVPTTLSETAKLPHYASDEAAGADLTAAINEPLTLEPGARTLVPTGLRVALPQGYELQLRPRSGWAFRHGITLLNTPGTIDSDYRGEIQVLLINLGDEAIVIEPGMRIAQAVLAPVVRAHFLPCQQPALPETKRGCGGFGSSGHF